MKTNISTLIILGLAFLFSACQVAEEPRVYEAVEYTGAEYLANYRTPDAMFLVSYFDIATEKKTGFIIDNAGNLKTLEAINYSVTPDNGTIHPDALQNMIDHGKQVAEIDLDVLVDQFKKIRLASRARTLDGESNPSATQNVEFYGFTLGVPGYTGGGNCQGAPSSSEYFSQFMLKSEGQSAKFLNSGNATELVEWLKTLHEQSVK